MNVTHKLRPITVTSASHIRHITFYPNWAIMSNPMSELSIDQSQSLPTLSQNDDVSLPEQLPSVIGNTVSLATPSHATPSLNREDTLNLPSETNPETPTPHHPRKTSSRSKGSDGKEKGSDKDKEKEKAAATPAAQKVFTIPITAPL